MTVLTDDAGDSASQTKLLDFGGHGETPLHVAVASGNSHLIKLLVAERGASLDNPRKKDGMT